MEIPLEIQEWVVSALEGDPQSFENLVFAFQDDVFNLCFRMLGERFEAEDAAQECFLRAYRNLSRFDIQRSFKTWLLSIASNYCIDRLRRRRISFVSLDDEPTAAFLSLASDEPNPESVAIGRETSKEFHGLLAQLPEDYRLVVVLRYWYDYSYSEIAEINGDSVSAVKSKLFRARRRLAESIPDTKIFFERKRGRSPEERLSIREEGDGYG